ASRPSAGRARILAGWQPRQPRGVHHAEYCGTRRASFICDRASAGKELIVVTEVPRPKLCSHAPVFGIILAPADAAAWDSTGTWPGPIRTAVAHMEDARAMTQKYSLNVNGKASTVEADQDMPLLYVLRND